MTMMRHARELVFRRASPTAPETSSPAVAGTWVTVVVPSVGLVCPDDVAPQSSPSLLLSANRLFFAAIRTRLGERPNARATSSCAWWIFSLEALNPLGQRLRAPAERRVHRRFESAHCLVAGHDAFGQGVLVEVGAQARHSVGEGAYVHADERALFRPGRS
jgi:hypothetical protein